MKYIHINSSKNNPLHLSFQNKKVSLLCCLIVFNLCLFAQTKNEQEKRIKFDELPKTTQELVRVLPKKSKQIKFYKETDGAKTSFEIKFKYKQRRYSVEFDVNGIMEDIEETIAFRKLKPPLKSVIQNHFKTEYEGYIIIKTQIQYIYSSKDQPSHFLNIVINQNYKGAVNYELIAEVRSKSNRDIKEFTFGNDGAYVKARVLNPSSYEHVLY
jgi:hypothetical protein